jgi:para-nitrobenzyl esterase
LTSLELRCRTMTVVRTLFLKLFSNMTLYSLALALLVAGSSYAHDSCPSPSAPSASTADGTLRGGRCAGTAVDFFLSIPYADRPVRYQSPAPYSAKYSKRDATVVAPACPQFGTTFVETGPQSEDW